MKPIGFLAAALGLAGAATVAFVVPGTTSGMVLEDALLTPMGAGHALTLKIENKGGADRLLGLSVDAATVATLGAGSLAIPAASAPVLAMDGVHGMALGLPADAGRLVPVTLTFERAGAVSTRARIGGEAMDHSASYPVPEGEPRPAVALVAARESGVWMLDVTVKNFRFSEAAADGSHQPGVGHGHLYLNGLKLQRIYGPVVRIGALPPGQHELRVTLNTNDHRAYSVDGQPVTAVARIVVD